MSEDLQGIIDALHHHTYHTRDACQRIARWLEALNAPAIPDTVALTATQPTKRLEEAEIARSIGIYNPNPVTVLLGYSGGSATPNARPWPIPASSALVLPILTTDVEIGADPADLAAGDAVVFVLRFPTVRDLSFGGI